MTEHTFETTIEQTGPTATAFEVPLDMRSVFGSVHPPVKVTVNRHTYRATPVVYGGRYYLPVSRFNRLAARVEAGARVTVHLELDEEPRKIEAPLDLALALDEDEEARDFWDRLSYSHRREYIEWINEAKRDGTREKRIEKAIEGLRGGEPKGRS
jgi:hypothetical protein